jgi:putative GTP pyrophosphokinase
MARKYSQNVVKQAGLILSKTEEFSTSEIENAQNVLTYWRTIHAALINTFQSNLRKHLSRLGFKEVLVAQRLKRSVSIVSKLKRFPNMKLSTMQDIAGIRVIVKNINQVHEIENKFRESKFKHILIDSKDYIANPAYSGYRSVHLIFQYVNPKIEESNGLKIELQIRTKLQHTWATAVETVGTFLNYSLKSSQGPEEWLEYFKIVSAGFAILENCPVHSEFQELSDKDLFGKIVDKTIELEVRSKLRGFTVAADKINQSKIRSKYNLITLNLDKKVLNIKSYFTRQLNQANHDYTNIEREINNGANIQAVLVSTGSIDSLRKTYPNYFLDTQEFLSKLDQIKKRFDKM